MAVYDLINEASDMTLIQSAPQEVCSEVPTTAPVEAAGAVCDMDEDDDDMSYASTVSSLSSSDDSGSESGPHHELFLPRDASPRQSPIRFSWNMDAIACDEYYRCLAEEEEAEAAKNGPAPQQRRRSEPRSMFGILRKKSSSSSSNNPAKEDDLGKKGAVRRRSSGCSVSSDCTESTVLTADDSLSSRFTIAFADVVTEYPVPSIGCYPDDVRSAVWNSVDEIRKNKQRNKKEYRYDFCDWRNATEEEDMPVDFFTGEHVHPAHVPTPVNGRGIKARPVRC